MAGLPTIEHPSHTHSTSLFVSKLTIIGCSNRIGLGQFWCIFCVIMVVQSDNTNQTPRI